MKMHPSSCRTGLRAPALPAALMTIVMSGLLITSPVAAAIAGSAGDPCRSSTIDAHRLHVCGSGRGEVTLEIDGQQLSVTRTEGDHVTTTVVDMDQVGRLVGDAVGEAMEAMEELQLQVRLGQDNRVDITTADGRIEVDLDQIMTQVAAAVQSGLEGVDTASWAATGPGSDVNDEELQLELARLQEEMRALRAELRRLHSRTGDAR